MNWALDEPGAHKSGCNNPYEKRPESFVKDYKELIDYMQQHKFNGLVIWGFLRDSRGGIESARRICEYGRKKGIRVIPGVGVLSYGGVYYEGNHRYNMDTHLGKYPSLAATDINGEKMYTPDKFSKNMTVACPSRKENIEWMQEAADWLSREFAIGGVNLETGDYGVCYCDRCREKSSANRERRVSVVDMARVLPSICRIIKKNKKEAWITYAVYTDFSGEDLFGEEREDKITDALKQIPDYAVAQYTLTNMVKENAIRRKTKPKTTHNIGYIHQGSPSQPDAVAPTIRACKLAAEYGLEGIAIYGEVSHKNLSHELNYLTFEHFSNNPGAPAEEIWN